MLPFTPLLSFLFLRRPLEGYSPTHRGRPFLRLHQRQLHRCKWKRIECYYWLPTKPTKPHPLARMSGLYTFIASSIQVIHHAMSSKTCVFLWCLVLFGSFHCVYLWVHQSTSALMYSRSRTHDSCATNNLFFTPNVGSVWLDRWIYFKTMLMSRSQSPTPVFMLDFKQIGRQKVRRSIFCEGRVCHLEILKKKQRHQVVTF